MASRIATATGDFTTAATWGVVDATSILDSEAFNTVLTTAYVESQTSTPGAITIDGIAVKVASRAAVPVGTMSVRLAQAGALVAGTEVTVNVSDVWVTAGEQGWYLFKFAAPVLLLAATLYTVSAKTSSAAMVFLYRNGTAGNWSRLLRTTTTGAPAAGDSLHILGEWTALGTKTNRTVTMNETVATDYGDGVVANPPGFTIGNGGSLVWATAAATNYLLRLSTRLAVYGGGTLSMGTVGTTCPRDSSMQLEFDCAAADGDFGLVCFAAFTGQGLSRTIGKLVVRCLLNTDEAAAQTVLGVDTDTGWLNADDIAIASTTRTPGQAETRVLSGGAGASSITVTAGLTNAHSGTSPTQAEVILLTRNVRIQSVSTTFMAFVYFGPAAVVDCDWVSFRYLGSTTVGKRGIESGIITGSLTMSYCALRDFDNHGLWFADNSNNFTVDHLTAYRIGGTSAACPGIDVEVTAGTAWSFTDIDIINGTAAAAGDALHLEAYGGTLTNIRCNSGTGYGLNMAVLFSAPESIHKAWSGFELHSNANAGMRVNGLDFGKLSNVNIWRNAPAASGGLQIDGVCAELTIEGGNFFGNLNNNVFFFQTTTAATNLILRNVSSNGDTTFPTICGIGVGGDACRLWLENCAFSVVSGIKTAHTYDIDAGFGSSELLEATFNYTLLSSATPIQNMLSPRGRSYYQYQSAQQVAGVNYKLYPRLGTVALDAAVFRTLAPSESLTPAGRGAGEKLPSAPIRVPIRAGAPVGISVYVRKSAAYTGSAPRLVQRANPAIGVLVDTVIATHSAAADVWQQLTGTTANATAIGVAEFFVDCDGALGVVYADDISAVS